MSSDLWITLAVLAVTMILFTREWIRLDVVALLSLLALLLAGVLEPAAALSGFSSSVVFIIAALFVVGTALFHTGVADWIGGRVAELAGTGQVRLTVVLMLVVAVLSAFMSSTGAVALFLPVAANLSRRSALSPSKLLMPIAFASLLGGMLTLIGTPANIVVSEQLSAEGREPFGFFEFTPVGAVILVMGIVYMVTLGQRLIPARTEEGTRSGGGDDLVLETVDSLVERYDLPSSLSEMRIRADSPLAGETLASLNIQAEHGVSVLGVCPRGTRVVRVFEQSELSHGRRFAVGDTIIVHGMPTHRAEFAEAFSLHVLDEEETQELTISSDAGFAEVVLPPRSGLIGETLRSLDFREVYGIGVMAGLHLGKAIPGPLVDHTLRFGDTLLVQGPWKRIHALRHRQRDFVVVGEARGETEPTRLERRGVIAVSIMTLMMILMTLGLPIVTVVLGAALAMLLTRCVSMEAAYRSMSWESLVVIAAMLPMAHALEETGAIELAATWLTESLGDLGPSAVIVGLFVVTSVFSQFISNTATAVLVAPIAFQAAQAMEVSERTYLMAVAIAASTAFATPIASPANTLVLTPGGYRFGDYGRVGVPLQLAILLATVLLLPLLFPL